MQLQLDFSLQGATTGWLDVASMYAMTTHGVRNCCSGIWLQLENFAIWCIHIEDTMLSFSTISCPIFTLAFAFVSPIFPLSILLVLLYDSFGNEVSF